MARSKNLRLPMLKVKQWNEAWEKVDFDEDASRRRPRTEFYLLSMSARDLRRLTGIHRRDARDITPRAHDQAIQRGLDATRSAEIAEYVEFGYPWSTLSAVKRESGDYDDLRKPGWLPTAIVINILEPDDTREGSTVHRSDVVHVDALNDDRTAELVLPDNFGPAWEAQQEPPFEVIDGQHRLWAFDVDDEDGDFELPVVAFHGLDIGWQAYLFYTINIKPKKIDTSLAYDLYPLLRSADWLERAEEHSVYRETRSQELVEALWSYPDSPWYDRIDMLGDQGRGVVSQAAWIRSLMATMVKRASGPGVRGVGGLFGSHGASGEPFVSWNRTQQAALLIQLWSSLSDAVLVSESEWATAIREESPSLDGDPAFVGKFSLLNTDQGVRGVLAVANDLLFVSADQLGLRSWRPSREPSTVAESGIRDALATLQATELTRFLDTLASHLSEWDWRTSATPGLEESERQLKARFRGGTGYKEIRLALLNHLASSSDAEIAEPASEILALVAD